MRTIEPNPSGTFGAAFEANGSAGHDHPIEAPAAGASYTPGMRNFQPAVIGLIFVGAGILHFVRPQMYESIMPPAIPAPHAMVLVSGVFEILGGAGVMIPATRRFAGWGLIALLVAVFPANVYMYLAADTKFAALAPKWALLARLPLQFVLMYWIYAACVKPRNAS